MNNSTDMDQNNKVSCFRIVCDLLIVCCFGIPILVLFLTGSAYQRGFYCDDESLRHPFKPSTVPSFYLYIFGFGLNAIAMVSLEYRRRNTKQNNKVVILGIEVPAWIWEAYMAFIIFCFGAACSQLITDVLKYTIGRLRPHFYTLCLPKFNGTKTCESLDIDLHKYIIDFKCTNPEVLSDERKMKEMRLSFPSGHSSFSMYTMLYLAIYIHARLKMIDYKLFKHGIQMGVILLALYTGMTRVSDYKHHWSDVLAGLSLGALVAIVVTRFVSPLFKHSGVKKYEGTMEMGHLNSNNQTNVT